MNLKMDMRKDGMIVSKKFYDRTLDSSEKGENMKSENEVLDALNVLKSVCEENNGCCSKCMLRNGEGYCGVFTNSRGDCYDSLMDLELKNYENPRVILS